MTSSELTLGPVLFNWSPEKWRDFYFSIADEAPVNEVYIGEVVCSKREPFFEPMITDVIERLQNAGKKVVLSTLALIMSEREMNRVRELAADSEFDIEANDISAVSLMAGRNHVVGPYVNVYNEGTLEFLISRGATRVCLPYELPADSIAEITNAATGRIELEVQVFGRLPLAISARCYHARSYDLSKDSCQFVCGEDPDGMAVDTLDGSPFLTVNGTQTLSRSCRMLAAELEDLRSMGISHFRLSPMDTDMVTIAKSFRAGLDGAESPEEIENVMADLLPGVPFSNGFFHGVEGSVYRNRGE